MANITAYTTTSGLLLDPNTPNPLANYSVSQLLQAVLGGLAEYNYYAALDARQGGSIYSVATDGSFQIDMSSYRVNAYGSYSTQGSNINEILITYKPTGQYLECIGTFVYNGLPWISNPTSGNLTQIINHYYNLPGEASQDTITGNLNFFGSSGYSGTINSVETVTYNISTNLGRGFAYNGTISASGDYLNPSQVQVPSGVINQSTEALFHGLNITDSLVGTGLSWNVTTKIGDLNLNTGDDIYTLTGTMGLDLNTGAANDVIYVQSPDNIVNGSEGTDIAIFSNSSSHYTVEFSDSATVVLDNTSSSDTDNTLLGVESISFSDFTLQSSWLNGALTLAQSDPAQFELLTQMYLAYFNRAPDAVGLDYWANIKYSGYTDSQIAAYFANSQESLDTFGTVSTSSSIQQINQFVNSVYLNVLDRTPDQAGLTYWSETIKSGAISGSDFILGVIIAVNEQQDTSADKIYFSNKTDVGLHFGVTNGLTNGTQGSDVMDLYNSVYTNSNPGAAVNTANQLSDYYLDNVATNQQLIVQLVGVVI